jgi:hypothetical protein
MTRVRGGIGVLLCVGVGFGFICVRIGIGVVRLSVVVEAGLLFRALGPLFLFLLFLDFPGLAVRAIERAVGLEEVADGKGASADVAKLHLFEDGLLGLGTLLFVGLLTIRKTPHAGVEEVAGGSLYIFRGWRDILLSLIHRRFLGYFHVRRGSQGGQVHLVSATRAEFASLGVVGSAVGTTHLKSSSGSPPSLLHLYQNLLSSYNGNPVSECPIRLDRAGKRLLL